MGEIVALFSRFVVAMSLVLMVACGEEEAEPSAPGASPAANPPAAEGEGEEELPTTELPSGSSVRTVAPEPATGCPANEVAVQTFLGGGLSMGAATDVVRDVLATHSPTPISSLEDVRSADRMAREITTELLAARGGATPPHATLTR